MPTASGSPLDSGVASESGIGWPDDEPAADSTDYVQVADEVYDRIERRIRTELFADLERRGHLMEWS